MIDEKRQGQSLTKHFAFNYYLLLAPTIFLVVFGLCMVFSASSVSQMQQGESATSLLLKQVVFAIIGLAGMFALANVSIEVYSRFSNLLIIIAFGLLAGTFTSGRAAGGNNNWLQIGLVSFQPSEFAKLAVSVWLGVQLAKLVRDGQISNIRSLLDKKILLGICGVVGCILAGKDLGTAMIFLVIIFIQLFIAGVRKRYLFITFLLGSALCAVFVLISENRKARILGNYTNCGGDTQHWCYQSTHGKYALATGGIWGVGPGASREKWSYLPEAHNDFILAIIGEELGVVGTLAVLICYGLMIWTMFHVVMHNNDLRCRIITAGIIAWIAGQAIFNIGAVLTFLPVIGVPLPLISYGGTSLISVLWVLGIVMSFIKMDARIFTGASKQYKKQAKDVITVLDNGVSR
ncbi:MAG: putative lipid II flippase FtsW [Candidatus Ancillula trichonymphae]|nr:putative lipid II flippase FtsW [Candidatus Ancillula trichonymphae]